MLGIVETMKTCQGIPPGCHCIRKINYSLKEKVRKPFATRWRLWRVIKPVLFPVVQGEPHPGSHQASQFSLPHQR
jgi:hypothetical protein